MASSSRFCTRCGSSVETTNIENAVNQIPVSQPYFPQNSAPKKRKTGIIIVSVLLAAVVCVVGGIVIYKLASDKDDSDETTRRPHSSRTESTRENDEETDAEPVTVVSYDTQATEPVATYSQEQLDSLSVYFTDNLKGLRLDGFINQWYQPENTYSSDFDLYYYGPLMTSISDELITYYAVHDATLTQDGRLIVNCVPSVYGLKLTDARDWLVYNGFCSATNVVFMNTAGETLLAPSNYNVADVQIPGDGYVYLYGESNGQFIPDAAQDFFLGLLDGAVYVLTSD